MQKIPPFFSYKSKLLLSKLHPYTLLLPALYFPAVLLPNVFLTALLLTALINDLFPHAFIFPTLLLTALLPLPANPYRFAILVFSIPKDIYLLQHDSHLIDSLFPVPIINQAA